MDAPRDSRATEFDETLRWIREEGWGPVEVRKWADWLITNTAGRTGFSARNLMRMKTFHEVWTEAGALPPLVRDLSWPCHLILLDKCASAQERAFYLEAAVRGKWSPDVLESKIRKRL